MRRSKIVCTLGPAVDSHEMLVSLIEAGMNVARFNFSHGSHAEHQGRYDRVRAAAKETGRAIGVLADLQGPKIRLETFAEGPVELERGDEFVILVEDGDTHNEVTHIAQKLQKTLQPVHQLGGHQILMTAIMGISSYPQDGEELTDLLRNAEKTHEGVAIGSYPFFREGRTGANFVVRATDGELMEACVVDLTAALTAAGRDVVAGGI
jgi:hypothetical protein